MTDKDFGKIALIVNEFGGLKHDIYIDANGRLVLKNTPMYQTLDPYDLNTILVVKQNEYKEVVDALSAERKERDEDEGPSWRERNLVSYIGFLKWAICDLNRLREFQQEQLSPDGTPKET